MSSNAAWRDALEAYVTREAQPPDKLAHQPRLYALAAAIAAEAARETGPVDDDVLHAAAWLHDLGVFTGHRPEELEALARWDHVAYAAREIPGVLATIGFPVEKTAAVIEAVRAHLPDSVPTTPEGTVLRDADLLEQLGAVAVLRTVSKVGRDTRFPTHAAAVASLVRARDTIPSLVRLPVARALAAPRVAALDAFLRAADAEARGVL